MIIKKLSERITYVQQTTLNELEVNGKKVAIFKHYQDSDYGDCESDTEIDEDDKEFLTEAELEELEDYLGEAVELEIDEKIDTKAKEVAQQ